MISRLKRRFIALAMTSLIVLLTFIVAGMNIINYNTVINEADQKLAALSVNGGMLPYYDDDYYGQSQKISPWFFGIDDDVDENDYDDSDDYDDYNDYDSFNRDGWMGLGRGRPFSSRDQAEETRFFSVLIAGDESVLRANTDRIYAVDDDAAGKYAVEALKKGGSNGFIDSYRYTITSEGSLTRITFLDCTSSLASFRQFLYSSIIMSVAGLIVIFIIVCYFAGRIVKPVAESYEKQKRFITDAGHEIKTPLAIIKANLDVMRMDLEDIDSARDSGVSDQNMESIRESSASLSESLGDIDGQVDRLTSLTNDLVYLSRMEEAGDTLKMTEIPVSDIVAETADSFGALAAERKKTLDINVATGLTMRGSSKEIEKLVSILTENALKYSPVDDTVHIDLRRDGKSIVLEVRNKAAEPLSDEDLAHVFDRFYRGDKSRNSASGGHGIGLSMASAITAAHGGKIRARSGDGTDFIVTAVMPAS